MGFDVEKWRADRIRSTYGLEVEAPAAERGEPAAVKPKAKPKAKPKKATP